MPSPPLILAGEIVHCESIFEGYGLEGRFIFSVHHPAVADKVCKDCVVAIRKLIE